MKSRVLLICSVTLFAVNTWGNNQVASVICADGAKQTMLLREVEPGAAGSREARSIDIGPAAQAWIKLPSGAKLAQYQPIPVMNLTAKSLEVQVEYAGGKREQTKVSMRREGGDGWTKVNVIQARIGTYSYAMPANCRVMSPSETHDYAQALLNNAGCLLPADVHRKLSAIPGASGHMLQDCGWEPDPRAAIRTLEKAAKLGSIHAGWVLSQLYLGNAGPDYANHRLAYLSLSHAAALGHASADLMSAVMRWRGDGVMPDAQAAFTTLLPYARNGSREAQGIIGTMYLTGSGAPENPMQAYTWCSLAADGGPVMYSDPGACRDEAKSELSYEQVLDAHDQAVEIQNGSW